MTAGEEQSSSKMKPVRRESPAAQKRSILKPSIRDTLLPVGEPQMLHLLNSTETNRHGLCEAS